MPRDLKYGIVSVTEENNFAFDEPVFIIRARDAVSVNAIWEYLNCYSKSAAGNVAPNEMQIFSDKVEKAIGNFEDWQRTNETKLPD